MTTHDRGQGKVATLRSAGYAGLVDTNYADCIEALIRDRDPKDWTAWSEVKQSTVRTIHRGDIVGPDGDKLSVHLKLFRAVRLSDRARDAVTGSRSAREFQNLRAAIDRGLPCVDPLAAGTAAGSCGSRSFLLTRTEPGRALPRGPLDPTTAAAAGALLRRTHDQGLHARDLHPGNLLHRPDGTLVLLDLTSAAFGDPLTESERGRALAYFCLDLDGNIEDPAARPLLRGYDASPTVARFAVQAARRLRQRALAAFGRRAFRPCATTTIDRIPRRPRVSWHRPAEHLWEHARAAFETLAEHEPIKSGRRGAVYRFDRVMVKVRSAAAARRLFESAYWLAFAGVPTPMPVAVTTFQSRGAVAIARLDRPNFHDELATGLDNATLRAVATQLGDAVGRLHSFGLRNRDLKFENLVRDPATNALHMVDLDGVKRQPPLDGRGRAGDLGRLLAAFEHAERPGGEESVQRFLTAYVRACKRLLVPVPHRKNVLETATMRALAWASAHA